MQREIDMRSRQARQRQRIDELQNQLNGFSANTCQPKPPSGSSPWGGFGNDVFTPLTSGQSPYTNSQGQGFMGSMSFAPNTPVSYQNQAYGKFANSQGYYQQPQQQAPQNPPAFRQGQAQPIQSQSQGTPYGSQPPGGIGQRGGFGRPPAPQRQWAPNKEALAGLRQRFGANAAFE